MSIKSCKSIYINISYNIIFTCICKYCIIYVLYYIILFAYINTIFFLVQKYYIVFFLVKKYYIVYVVKNEIIQSSLKLCWSIMDGSKWAGLWDLLRKWRPIWPKKRSGGPLSRTTGHTWCTSLPLLLIPFSHRICLFQRI